MRLSPASCANATLNNWGQTTVSAQQAVMITLETFSSSTPSSSKSLDGPTNSIDKNL
jgi:hypothetical protein